MTEDTLPQIPRAHDALAEGERRRDSAHANLNHYRAVIVRRLQRGFIRLLLRCGEATIDALRAAVSVPTGTDPRVVGAAVRGLTLMGVVISVGRRQSIRAEAHARQLELWAISDRPAAIAWLDAHPELSDPEPTAPPV